MFGFVVISVIFVLGEFCGCYLMLIWYGFLCLLMIWC